MEVMIAKWINETRNEYEHAKRNRNLFKMNQMDRLVRALRQMRDNLLKLIT